MNLANFQKDKNGNLIGLKKCKYHCDYGDGEHCHYKGIDGCIYNKTKGKRMTDAEDQLQDRSELSDSGQFADMPTMQSAT